MATAFSIYAAAWLSFGLLHSLLALPSGRRALGRVAGDRHRLAYNLIATIHLAAVFALGMLAFSGNNPQLIPPWMAPVGWFAVAVGALTMLQAARAYDSGLFTGAVPTPPDSDAGDAEPLILHGWNARVRHPLYFAGLLILWGLAQTAFGLATALYGTVYILLGAMAEERKLLRRHGDAYRRYRERVPMLIPNPFRRPSAH